MGLNIKNEKVVALVRRLAARRGTDMTEAIRQAVEHELATDAQSITAQLRAIAEIQARVAALPVLDARPVSEIVDEMYEGME